MGGDSVLKKLRRRKRGRKRLTVLQIDNDTRFDGHDLEEILVRGNYEDHKKAKKVSMNSAVSEALRNSNSGLRRVSTVRPKLPDLSNAKQTRKRAKRNVRSILRYYGKTILVQKDSRGHVRVVQEDPDAVRAYDGNDDKV